MCLGVFYFIMTGSNKSQRKGQTRQKEKEPREKTTDSHLSYMKYPEVHQLYI